jgi:zinc transport system substrate-binding protein
MPDRNRRLGSQLLRGRPASLVDLKMAQAKPKSATINHANETLTPVGALMTKLVSVLLLVALPFSGCSEPSTLSKRTPQIGPSNQITAVGYPLSFFAHQLLDGSIKIHTLAPDKKSTTPWRPSHAEILTMQKSDIIFVNGSAAPFANWLPHVTLPESKLCATANEGLKLADMIAVEDIRIVHSHGPEGEHSHPTMVRYPWLDPAMAMGQVDVMASRLIKTYPAMESSITKSHQELNKELAQLSAGIEQIAATKTSPVSILTDSPDLKYLTRALSLQDVHLNWSEPLGIDEAKAQLQEKLSSTNPSPEFMLFANEPDQTLRSSVESLGLKIILLDSMARVPDLDYFRVMANNLHQLQLVLALESNQAKPQASASEQN